LERFKAYKRIPVESAVLIGPGPFHRDGEPEGPGERFEVRVRPRALRVLVPRRTAEDPTGPFTPE
jgi:diacylglycerol kinase family enzyme